MIKQLLFCTSLLLFSAGSYNARVIKITDGDTIVVLTEDNRQVKIRLDGIDCPESKQAYGNRAKQATADFCFGKNVRVEKTGMDVYGRTLARVYVNKICLNDYLLETGMAWHFKRYNKDAVLARMEVDAKKKKIGLWSQPNPVAPWDWRKQK